MRNRHSVAVVLMAAACCTATACGSNDSAAPTVTVTAAPTTNTAGPGTAAATPVVTQTKVVEPSTASESAEGSAGPATAGNGKCLDPTSATVARALQSLGTFGGRPYVAYESSPEKLGSCPNMLWVDSSIQGATGSSPDHVLFFDADGYLGTATKRPSAFTTVTGHSADSVDVEYRWINGNEPNCCTQGGPVTVRFTLASGKVTPDREIPAQALGTG